MSIPLPPTGIHPEEFVFMSDAQLRARDLEAARVVLEAAASVLDGECLDRLQRTIYALEFGHE